MQLNQLAATEVLALVHFFTKENTYGKPGKSQWLKISSMQVLLFNLEEQGSHAYAPPFHSFSKVKKKISKIASTKKKTRSSIKFLYFLEYVFVSLLSPAYCYVVVTRSQNFISEHNKYKGTGI